MKRGAYVLAGEQARGVAGALARKALRRVVPAGGPAPDSAPPRPLEVTVGEMTIRPLRASDQEAWTASMRSNRERMSPWWHGAENWEAGTGPQAFYDHYVDWLVARRKGVGHALAIVERNLLVGELHIYRAHGGRSVEFGLWCRPDGVSGRAMLGSLCGVVDRLIGDHGVERIDAPVAVGNSQPVKLLTLSGFAAEGTMEGWRPLQGEMVDYTLYGMTARRWRDARLRPYRIAPWPQQVEALPVP